MDLEITVGRTSFIKVTAFSSLMASAVRLRRASSRQLAAVSRPTLRSFHPSRCPHHKGNSGCPSFDVDGDVVGVNTAIFSPSGGSVGIGFAIRATTVKPVIQQLKEKGVVTRGALGVEVQPVTPDIASALGLKRIEGLW